MRLLTVGPLRREAARHSSVPHRRRAAFTTHAPLRNAGYIDDPDALGTEKPLDTHSAGAADAGEREQRRRRPRAEGEPHPPQLPRAAPDVRHVRAHPRLHAANCSLRGYAELVGHPARVAGMSGRLRAVDGRARELQGRRGALVARMLRPGGGGGAAGERVGGEGQDEEIDGEEAKLRAEIRAVGEQADGLLAEARAVRGEIARLAGELPVLMVEGVGATERVLDVFEPAKDGATANDGTAAGDAAAAKDGAAAEGPTATVRLVPPAARPRQRASHVEIGRHLDLLALAPEAAAVAGHGHYFLLNAGARLERALVEHALRAAAAAGFAAVAPPSIVYRAVAGACGFRPRAGAGSEIFDVSSAPASPPPDRRHAESQGAPPHVLAGTAEIPLAGLYAGRTLARGEAPARLVGVSRCFRAEAGARGRRDRGLFRVHEFTKVELFAWCAPDPEPAAKEGEDGAEKGTWYDAGLEARCPRPDAFSYVDTSVLPEPAPADRPPPPLPRYLDAATDTQSAELFRQMLALQLAIHRPLGLPLRTLLLPARDLGASAALKVDLEALFPAAGEGEDPRWGEVCSLALCADYQARRLGVRVDGGGGPQFAWSLNGTALAVPRVWAAVVERGWDEERGVVRLPECLWGLMGMREIARQ
jgi:seryl-tRNA synthetase